MERPRIDHARRSGAVLLRLMGVAIKQEIEVAAVLDIFEQPFVVSVHPGKLALRQLEIAKRLLKRAADPVDSLAEARALTITIAKHEMHRQAFKEPHRIGIVDVSA